MHAIPVNNNGNLLPAASFGRNLHWKVVTQDSLPSLTQSAAQSLQTDNLHDISFDTMNVVHCGQHTNFPMFNGENSLFEAWVKDLEVVFKHLEWDADHQSRVMVIPTLLTGPVKICYHNMPYGMKRDHNALFKGTESSVWTAFEECNTCFQTA